MNFATDSQPKDMSLWRDTTNWGARTVRQSVYLNRDAARLSAGHRASLMWRIKGGMPRKMDSVPVLNDPAIGGTMSPRSKRILDIAALISVLAFPLIAIIGNKYNDTSSARHILIELFVANIIPSTAGLLWIIVRNIDLINSFRRTTYILRNDAAFKIFGVPLGLIVGIIISEMSR